jgi:hypothetical protein
MIEFFVGVHDYFDNKLKQWFHTYHFHIHYYDIFHLDFTDNGDCFGKSLVMEDPDSDYESFRFGGIIKSIDIPENFTKHGKVSRNDFDAYMNVNNGTITET